MKDAHLIAVVVIIKLAINAIHNYNLFKMINVLNHIIVIKVIIHILIIFIKWQFLIQQIFAILNVLQTVNINF